MSIVGDRPTRGMRLRLVLDRTRSSYQGTATTPTERWELRVTLDGEITVETSAPKEVADYARRVVRIAARDAAAEGTGPPRVIQRWRA